MGKRGPARTPTVILDQRGSRLVKKRQGEPQFDERAVRPKYLSKLEVEVWNRVAPKLAKQKVLTGADVATLGRYCQLFISYLKAQAFITANGISYEGPSGRKEWPEARARIQLAQELLRIEREFGLTPASRSNVAGQLMPETDAFDKWKDT